MADRINKQANAQNIIMYVLRSEYGTTKAKS